MIEKIEPVAFAYDNDVHWNYDNHGKTFLYTHQQLEAAIEATKEKAAKVAGEL